MCRITIVLLALLLASISSAPAQLFRAGDSGPRPLLPPEREIALARSAAPPEVSRDASVYVLTSDGYELAIEGTNGAACYVSRSWIASLEPHCFDREAAATIMRIQMRRGELLHEGVSIEEMSRIVAAELMEGEFRLPDRLAMSWMLSSEQKLVSNDGRPVGAWKPHVMIYYPYLTAEDVALGGPASSGPADIQISNGGTALANMVIVVPEFIAPASAAAAER